MKRYMNYPIYNFIIVAVTAFVDFMLFLGLVIALKTPALCVVLIIPGFHIAIAVAHGMFWYQKNQAGKDALKGHKAIGKVLKKKTTYYGKIRRYTVDISYTSDDNKELVATAFVDFNNLDLFIEGKDIPIYVNGENAMFLIAEVKDINALKERVEAKVLQYKKCPYCDSMIELSAIYCNHCGATNLTK